MGWLARETFSCRVFVIAIGHSKLGQTKMAALMIGKGFFDFAPDFARKWPKFREFRRLITTTTTVDVPVSENDVDVNPQFENRNPRNLEKICMARKPKGFELDTPTKAYWHKIFLERGDRHTTARVEHFTGKTVVSASTREWAIRKHLYSSRDVCAAANIARVLCQRCLESGILYVHSQFTQEETQSETISAFIAALKDGGLGLEEPRRIYPVRDWD